MKTRILSLLCLMASIFTLFASASFAADYDLSKALVIGNGPKKVIEFTDPDCPFCRKASHYFDSRRDVTRYIFFNPLPSHPQAKRKVQYIMSHSDIHRAYMDVMDGLLDNAGQMRLPVTEKGVRLQETQQEIARKSGYNATPTFVISGRVIEGFDLLRIKELLGK